MTADSLPPGQRDLFRGAVGPRPLALAWWGWCWLKAIGLSRAPRQPPAAGSTSLRRPLDIPSAGRNPVIQGHPAAVERPIARESAGDWSPAAVLASAQSRWMSPAEILDTGPEHERADRLAAYRRGRSLLIKSLFGRDGGRQCV